jgi:hypothetical protein
MAIKNITQVKLKGMYELGNFHLLIEALQNKIRPAVKLEKQHIVYQLYCIIIYIFGINYLALVLPIELSIIFY